MRSTHDNKSSTSRKTNSEAWLHRLKPVCTVPARTDAEVFDLLDIRLHRVAEDRFEGTGTIPIPDDEGGNGDLLPVGSGGEVSKAGPRDLKPLLVGFLRFFPAGGASNPTLAVVTLSVRLPDHLIVCDTGRPVLAPIPIRLLGSDAGLEASPPVLTLRLQGFNIAKPFETRTIP